MGLDMWLEKKYYFYSDENFKKEEIHCKKCNLNLEEVQYASTEVAYWRKVNAIHQWFVDHCQGGEDDCRSAWVSVEQLQNLVDTCKKCKKVRGKNKEQERLEELLPTQDGFFFGSTDYDEYYWEQIDYTIEALEAAIKEYNHWDERRQFKNSDESKYYIEFRYESSW